MIKPLIALQLLAMIAICTSGSLRAATPPSQDPCVQERLDWLDRTLQQMKSIKPGMTREDLLKVFTTEGGLSTGLHRTYVSQACAYCKVDVEFRAVGRADRDGDGRVTLGEDLRDVIVKISRPYLQLSIYD